MKPGQTQSNRFDPGLTTNQIILSELLMLSSVLLHDEFGRRDVAEGIKPNQTLRQ
jgi:hypothetical protein